MRPRTWLLALVTIVAAAFVVLAVACGGDEEGPAAGETPAAAETPAAGETPAAAETPAAGETPERTPAGEAGELPSIPVYPGATELSTATFTGAEPFPIPVVGQLSVPQPGEFSNVQYSVFETSDSPEKVLDFYEQELDEWFAGIKEGWSVDLEQLGQKGEVACWSNNLLGFAAWVAATEEDGTTNVVVAMGARE